MRMRRLLVLLAAALALSGCGGSDKPKAAKVNTPQAVVDLMGRGGVICSGLTADTPALYAREQGACQIGGERVSISTFDGAEQRDRWLQVARQFGGIYVIGPGWVVSVASQTTSDRVAQATGGKI